MKPTILTILLLCLRAGAMDVDWNALGMIESGNNDYAVGRAGERSQWQMLPKVVKEWGFDSKRLANSPYALDCCKKVMAYRIVAYCHRAATPSDFYCALLWRCPARLRHPTAADRDYAKRYSNLAKANRKKQRKI